MRQYTLIRKLSVLVTYELNQTCGIKLLRDTCMGRCAGSDVSLLIARGGQLSHIQAAVTINLLP